MERMCSPDCNINRVRYYTARRYISSLSTQVSMSICINTALLSFIHSLAWRLAAPGPAAAARWPSTSGWRISGTGSRTQPATRYPVTEVRRSRGHCSPDRSGASQSWSWGRGGAPCCGGHGCWRGCLHTIHQLEVSTLLLASHVLGFFFTNVFAHVSQNMMDLSCSWSWSGLVTLFSDFVWRIDINSHKVWCK